MPEKVEEIAQSLIADPNFQPQEGRTKEESAYAVANAQVQKMGNPENPGVNDFARADLLTFADELKYSGDDELEVLGRRLCLAVNRGDWKTAKKVLQDMKGTTGLNEDFMKPLLDEYIDAVEEQRRIAEGGNGQG